MITSGNPPQDMMEHINNETPSFIVQANKKVTSAASISYLILGLCLTAISLGLASLITINAPVFEIPVSFVYKCYAVFAFPLLMGLLSLRYGAISRDMKGPWIVDLKEGLLVYHAKLAHHIYNWENSKLTIYPNKSAIFIRPKQRGNNSNFYRTDTVLEIPQFEEVSQIIKKHFPEQEEIKMPIKKIILLQIITFPITLILLFAAFNFHPNLENSSSETYQNQEFGFNLTIPETWGEISETYQEKDPFFETISLTSVNDSNRFFEIHVILADQTNASAVKDYPHSFITQNEQFAFYYNGGGDYAGMPNYEDEKFSQILSETKAIASSFKFTNSNHP